MKTNTTLTPMLRTFESLQERLEYQNPLFLIEELEEQQQMTRAVFLTNGEYNGYEFFCAMSLIHDRRKGKQYLKDLVQYIEDEHEDLFQEFAETLMERRCQTLVIDQPCVKTFSIEKPIIDMKDVIGIAVEIEICNGIKVFPEMIVCKPLPNGISDGI